MNKFADWTGFTPLVAAILIATATPICVLIQQNAPDPSSPVVILSAPWSSAARVAEAASGSLIRSGRIDSVGLVFVEASDPVGSLRESGAWLVLNGRLSNALCAPS